MTSQGYYKEHIETFYNMNFSYTGNSECDVYIVKLQRICVFYLIHTVNELVSKTVK